MVQCKFCGEDRLVWFQENGKWVLKKELENGQYSKGNHNCKKKTETKKKSAEGVEQSHMISNQTTSDAKSVSKENTERK